MWHTRTAGLPFCVIPAGTHALGAPSRRAEANSDDASEGGPRGEEREHGPHSNGQSSQRDPEMPEKMGIRTLE